MEGQEVLKLAEPSVTAFRMDHIVVQTEGVQTSPNLLLSPSGPATRDAATFPINFFHGAASTTGTSGPHPKRRYRIHSPSCVASAGFGSVPSPASVAENSSRATA